jgi:hypothetical protein
MFAYQYVLEAEITTLDEESTDVASGADAASKPSSPEPAVPGE